MTNAATKQCKGCNAALLQSDPDVCELCDLHGHDTRNPVQGRAVTK